MTTIDEALDAFLAEQDKRLAERTYRNYLEVIELFPGLHERRTTPPMAAGPGDDGLGHHRRHAGNRRLSPTERIGVVPAALLGP